MALAVFRLNTSFKQAFSADLGCAGDLNIKHESVTHTHGMMNVYVVKAKRSEASKNVQRQSVKSIEIINEIILKHTIVLCLYLLKEKKKKI